MKKKNLSPKNVVKMTNYIKKKAHQKLSKEIFEEDNLMQKRRDRIKKKKKIFKKFKKKN